MPDGRSERQTCRLQLLGCYTALTFTQFLDSPLIRCGFRSWLAMQLHSRREFLYGVRHTQNSFAESAPRLSKLSIEQVQRDQRSWDISVISQQCHCQVAEDRGSQVVLE